MSNHDLKPIEHSNTVIQQNENNTSTVSVLPLVGNETIKIEENLTVTSDLPSAPPPPQSTGINY